ncbi:substrate-binding periplasmic protein [Algicola sagamiensis]|uniref:substrate-binding periplasmic protein n=1 Tax=Algicola sagamiensis TaxID=163869 RepID=UPI00036B85AC|nr:transporter substrate-binding domain-containing protein [Algicola sagamiensis]
MHHGLKVVSFILLLFFVTGAYAQKKVIVLSNGEWPPFLGEELVDHGPTSYIVSEAFRRFGYQVNYKFYPWSRAYHTAKRGTVLGSVIWTYSTNRAKDFFFSDSVLHTKDVLFHLKSHPIEWEKLEDLKPYLIGATNKYFYGQAFSDAETVGTLMVDRIPNEEKNFLKLLHKRIDVALINYYVGLELIRLHVPLDEQSKIVSHPRPVYENEYHLILSKNRPESKDLVKKFNQALKEMISEGIVEKVYSGETHLPGQ